MATCSGTGESMTRVPWGRVSVSLTVVVTNRTLEARPLKQLAAQVHASMARAFQPFHALVDGDVLYAVTTDEIDDDSMDSLTLGVIASELAWDAVLASFDDDRGV